MWGWGCVLTRETRVDALTRALSVFQHSNSSTSFAPVVFANVTIVNVRRQRIRRTVSVLFLVFLFLLLLLLSAAPKKIQYLFHTLPFDKHSLAPL